MIPFLASYGIEFILLSTTVSIFWIGGKIKQPIAKHLLLNIGAICFAVLIYEFYLTQGEIASTTTLYSGKYTAHKPSLGYGIQDSLFSIRATKKEVKSDKKIYEADYSFSHGIRQTPNSDSLSLNHAIFLGGSFMFGEGVNDDETLPYYYNESADKRLNIKNYGFQGYGTHQAFTLVKNKITADSSLIDATNVDVFYWSIDAHILRASGYAPWDSNGPQYKLKDQRIEHVGSFRQSKKNRSFLTKVSNFLLDGSAIYNTWFREILTSGKEEVDLFLALIKASDQLLKQKGYRFTVLIQSESEQSNWLLHQHYQSIVKRMKLFFEEFQIEYVDINQVVKEQGFTIDSLTIPADGHPTPQLNKLIAEHLWGRK